MRKLMPFLVLSIFLGCCNSKGNDIDKIIDKYNTTDFSVLKNKSIYFRSRGSRNGASIYFINKYKGTCSPYVVEFDNNKKQIIEIKKHLVISSCGMDYLTEQEITNAIKKFSEYKLSLIQVDEFGNVYINPDKQDLPTLLRKSSNSKATVDLKLFKLYHGTWYIRK